MILEFLKNYTSQLISLGVAGTLFLILLRHKLAKRRAFEQRRAVAAKEFRSKFLECLEGLYPPVNKWPKDFIEITNLFNSKAPILHVAIENYKPYITKRELHKFSQAWNEFCGIDPSNPNRHDFFQYTGAKLDGEPKKAPELILKENVEKLLKFAKHR